MTARIFLLAFCLFGVQHVSGQDTEAWTMAEARYKLQKEWRLDLGSGFRFNQNASQFKSNLYEVGIRYRIVKGVFVRAAYRYSISTSDKGDGQRFSGALFYRKKVKRITFGLRSKYQYDFGNSFAQGSMLSRNKLSVRYSRKKIPWSPSVFGEVFNPLSDISNLNEWRLGTGLSYSINKRQSVGLKYFYNKRIKSDGSSARNVIALGFDWNLN